jgi:hypothetical protein
VANLRTYLKKKHLDINHTQPALDIATRLEGKQRKGVEEGRQGSIGHGIRTSSSLS